MIRDLTEWPEEISGMVREALAGRYLLRLITRVHALRLDQGYLDIDIETPEERLTLTMRWTGASVSEFGETGKLLTDTSGNRFLVEDISKLPPADQERFLHYVYW